MAALAVPGVAAVRRVRVRRSGPSLFCDVQVRGGEGGGSQRETPCVTLPRLRCDSSGVYGKPHPSPPRPAACQVSLDGRFVSSAADAVRVSAAVRASVLGSQPAAVECSVEVRPPPPPAAASPTPPPPALPQLTPASARSLVLAPPLCASVAPGADSSARCLCPLLPKPTPPSAFPHLAHAHAHDGREGHDCHGHAH